MCWMRLCCCELLQFWQSLPSRSTLWCIQSASMRASLNRTWRPCMNWYHCRCPRPVAERVSPAVQGNLVAQQEVARQQAGEGQTLHQQGAAAQGPPADGLASGGAAGAFPAWPAEVSDVQQAPVAARGRPGGGPQAAQAASGGLAGLAAQSHAARRPQTAPLSSQRPLSRAAAQAGSQTHRTAVAVKQQKESVMDTMDLQYLCCDGWLGIKAVHGSRPATAAAGECRQGGCAARPTSARRRPRPVSAGAQCRSGGTHVPRSPRLSARQGVGPNQHWQASSPALLAASFLLQVSAKAAAPHC